MKSTESITRRNKLLMVSFQERFITRLGSRMKRDVCHVWPVIIVMALGILFLKRSVKKGTGAEEDRLNKCL